MREDTLNFAFSVLVNNPLKLCVILNEYTGNCVWVSSWLSQISEKNIDIEVVALPTKQQS